MQLFSKCLQQAKSQYLAEKGGFGSISHNWMMIYSGIILTPTTDYLQTPTLVTRGPSRHREFAIIEQYKEIGEEDIQDKILYLYHLIVGSCWGLSAQQSKSAPLIENSAQMSRDWYIFSQ